MSTAIINPQYEVFEDEQQRKCITYQHAGYQIRVHFNGTKTFVECLKNLAERKLED